MKKSDNKKLKSAKKYVSVKDKMEETESKVQDIPSSVSATPSDSPEDPSQTEPEKVDESEVQPEDNGVVVPERQTDSEPPDKSEDSLVPEELAMSLLAKLTVKDFSSIFETLLNTILNNRNEANKKADQEYREKQKAIGITVLSPEEAVEKCIGYLHAIEKDYNIYVDHKHTVSKHQENIDNSLKNISGTVKQLDVIVGRIEKTQGVKAPKRPPFPSWACLTFLFWHWPMYAFSYMWLSKYFRRFCFLVAFFIMLLELCLIILLAGDNRTMHYERTKYNIVRNWSYVMEDSAAMNRFNKVDLLFEDIEFNKDKIIELNDFIHAKYEQNERRRK